MKEKISACIITFNEEHNIGECLESLAWADEIIVIDSGSTDKTEEICRKNGVRFYVHPFTGFRDQKNRALEKASNDWIISLDADERVTAGLKEEIINRLGEQERDGYFVPRLNFYGDKFIKHSGWYPDRKIRVWRRSKGKWVGRNVHEKVEVNGSVGYLQNGITHFTFRGIGDNLRRIDLYSTLAAQERVRAGGRFSLVKLLFKPPVKFIRSYLLKLGFLDGIEGLIIAMMGCSMKFLEEVKVRELTKRELEKNLS